MGSEMCIRDRAGTVHVGMDTGLIALKIQRAIGRQVYLICIIFIVGVFAAIWLVNLAAKPMGGLLAYTVDVARQAGHDSEPADGPELTAQARENLLARSDEVGHIARLFSYLAELADQGRPRSATATGDPS